ncbi:prophage Lp1 protein 5 [Bifidobacterium imperatoris]|uniref:Prophage Lp1 protein 5 n=1 Tax=Bifidobacterium imperatoris TaxID=2020965 RepID=A0A2N5IVB1_9BIFI|nr:prophage Lp1 protein 5 [Bifidobacterium imperatoris]
MPADYKSALRQADAYANTMHMSKAGVYDQLTSEYGGKFSAEAAQYAVDNVKTDWNANALAKAKTYQETMAMSPEAIRDQLTSQAGEKFTPEEANYAIEHLND